MLHRIALIGALALVYVFAGRPAAAQTVQVVQDCAGVTAPGGPGGRLYTDQGGRLCSASVAVPAMSTQGGLNVYRVMNAASAAAVAVKASAGRLYSFNLCNNANAARYVRFYNSATAATTGTTPVYAGAITLSAGTCQQFTTNFGLTFSAGISMAITAANGDADATAPLAGDVSGFLGYL
ncbi:hypothetical protein VQ02_27505 [Methylobacterium variabile]|jgi:hypothetical protein|uniref:Spore coat protein U domain-containing protein n=1 Tax=Methylobacterium variabile TaxID=298794 RepID=A0A0J6SBJ2_9HYPH|nr:hypothetical protein [Methylobacterium variabile]KMO30713.1 hypothetical protein VQ02_27505 [Methylobacterium variabile]